MDNSSCIEGIELVDFDYLHINKGCGPFDNADIIEVYVNLDGEEIFRQVPVTDSELLRPYYVRFTAFEIYQLPYTIEPSSVVISYLKNGQDITFSDTFKSVELTRNSLPTNKWIRFDTEDSWHENLAIKPSAFSEYRIENEALVFDSSHFDPIFVEDCLPDDELLRFNKFGSFTYGNTITLCPRFDNLEAGTSPALKFDIKYEENGVPIPSKYDSLKVLYGVFEGVDRSRRSISNLIYGPVNHLDEQFKTIQVPLNPNDYELIHLTTTAMGGKVTIDNIRIEALSTNINEVKEHDNLHINPNPSHGLLYINHNNTYSESSRIRIYNALGVEVFDKKVTGAAGEPLKVHHLPNGYYIYKIHDADNEIITTSTFVLMK